MTAEPSGVPPAPAEAGPQPPLGGVAEVVLATRNRGKAAELGRLLAPAGWNLLTLDEAPGGEGTSWSEGFVGYRENASLKSLAVYLATGMASLGDDSGIELEALGGFPGIRSARWLGEGATPEQLLAAICAKVAELPTDSRGARFVCTLALALPGAASEPQLTVASGSVAGTLVAEPRGSGGFGYDPIFIPAGETATMAEMSRDAKDHWSHRGRAARNLIEQLRSAPGGPGSAGFGSGR